MVVEDLDELIEHLQALRERLGGDVPVRGRGPKRHALELSVTVEALGKGDGRTFVSRGGNACIAFGEP